MSIFKESFKRYIRKQIAIREKIISIGNNGESRFKKNKVELSKLGLGKDIDIPESAFFIQNQRTCFLRMSSGADITAEGAEELGDNTKYYKADHLVGSGLARRYVLQGGTLTTDRKLKREVQTRDYEESEDVTSTGDVEVDRTLVGKGIRLGLDNTKTRSVEYQTEQITNVRETQIDDEVSYRTGQRSGFRGTSPNDFGTAYGDPTIGSSPINDYGQVPMPGIEKAAIRTKTAYGSLREAKIEFVCHNQRQLEALELLYMRPGIPVLLEWGWTSYIDNKGKHVKNEFPYIAEWWQESFSMPKLCEVLIKHKVNSGGNYDAINGMVKNFNYKARPDGGYDCTTELIAQGEILESLKGNNITVHKQKENEGEVMDMLKLCLMQILAWSKSKQKTRSALISGEEGTEEQETIDNIQTALYSVGDGSWDFTGTIPMSTAMMGASVPGFIAMHHMAALKVMMDNKSFEKVAKGTALKKVFGIDRLGLSEEESNTLLNSYVLHADRYKGAQLIGNEVDNICYIRWDALIIMLNLWVIEKDAHHQPLVLLSPEMFVEGKDGEEMISPLLMAKVPHIKVPNGDGTYKDTFKPEDFKGQSFPEGSAGIHATKLVDMSVDPSVCLLPNQVMDDFELKHPNGGILKQANELMNKTTTVVDGDGFFKKFGKGFLRATHNSMLYSNPTGWWVLGLGALEQDIKENRYNLLSQDKYGSVEERKIGNIYLNVQYLVDLYKEMAESQEGSDDIPEFNLFDWVKQIWDDVSSATGDNHKFEMHVDLERPHIIRVVDMQFQQEEALKPENLYELKIQSNETVCRDFAYHSLIPSSLSATIGISVQNPDNVNDLDQVTFAALSRSVKSRFHNPRDIDQSIGRKEPSDERKELKASKYDADVAEVKSLLDGLFKHRIKMLFGKLQYTKNKDGRKEKIKKQKKAIKKVNTLINKLSTLHSNDGKYDDGVAYYKGFFKQRKTTPPMSAVIPLKFDAKVDGISGIVIGNLFRIDPTRLPIMYQRANIGFAVMGESQDVTAGGDWTTNFKGQLILLDNPANEDPEAAIDMLNAASNLPIVGPAASIAANIAEQHLENKSPDVEETKEQTNDNKDQSTDQKSVELEKQNNCPEGHYWSEEAQRCVPENEDDIINDDVPEGVVISANNPEVPVEVQIYNYNGPLKEIELYTYKGQAGTYVISVDDSARPYADQNGTSDWDAIVYVSDVIDPKDDVVREIINDFGKEGRYKTYLKSSESYRQDPIPNPNRLSIDSETLPVPLDELTDAIKRQIKNIQEYEYNYWDGYTDPEWDGSEEPPSIDQNGNPTGWNPNLTPGGNNVGNPDNFA